jgi:Uma2 family endonuclease
MATETPDLTISSSPFPRPDQVYRLTVEQYDQMIRDRILLEDEAVELLNGVLVTKMPKNPRHRVATRKTVRALEKVLPAGWIVQKEEAIVIPSGSKLEPDVAIIRSELEFDSSRDALATDCCLVVEVADNNSLARSEKLPAFVAAGIPVYWIVNLAPGKIPWSALVEVYSDPDPEMGRYRVRVNFEAGKDVPVVIEGREVARIPVADLLP